MCEVLPPAETDELLRLALVIRSIDRLDPNEPAARDELRILLASLSAVEAWGRRLRAVALERMVATLSEQPQAFTDLYDLAQLAQVSPSELERLVDRPEQSPPVDPAPTPTPDAGD